MSDRFPYSFGKYRVEAEIGRGGFGTVFRAVDVDLDRPVAIKVLDPLYMRDQRWVAHFRREARVMAKLDHPNIVPIYEIGEEEGRLFLAMKFIDGPDLTEIISEKGALPWDEVVALVGQIASALDFAHEHNVIHRDLKPGNILVNGDQAMLTDFGLAQMMESNSQSISMSGGVAGTYNYMPPEIFNNEEATPAADVYALGCVVYEMLVGHILFDGRTTAAIISAHLKGITLDEPLPEGTPPGTREILLMALAKDPHARFSSAVVLAQELQRISNDPLQTQDAIPEEAPHVEDPIATAVFTQPAVQAQDTGSVRKLPFPRWVAVALLAFAILLGIAAVAGVTILRSSGPASLEGMINIPAGTYQIGSGSGDADHEAESEIALDAYLIDKYEVTNAQYLDFVDAAGGPSPASWSGGNYAEGQATFPVTGISWDMANAYCDWLNKRLPSEAEWETAARGDQALLYPWGDSANQVTLPEGSPYQVGTFLADHSFFGLFDMAYNVHEWVGEPYAQVPSAEKVLRGGSAQLPVDLSTRITGDPNAATMMQQAGFRCAVDADEEIDLVSPDLLFRDDFTSPDTGWAIGSGDNPGYHTPDWYHLEALSSGPLVLLGTEGNNNRGDLSIVTEVFLSTAQTINDGDFRYGLVARKSDDQSYYAFMISPNDRSWSVVKQTPAGPIEIASGQDESIVGSDLHNWLRLDTSGQSFLFWINGRLAYQFSDPEAPATGDIGYIVETLGASKVHIHVDYLEVTELAPNLVPAPSIQSDAIATTLTDTMAPTVTITPAPTATPPPMPTPTPIPTPTVDPNQLPPDPVLGSTWQRPQGDMTMVFVPAGSFSRGSVDGNIDEEPIHNVILGSFWIDQTEVTYSQYAEFLNEMGNQEEDGKTWYSTGVSDIQIEEEDGMFAVQQEFADHPVTDVSWQGAAAFCTWVGGNLPSEAQWEYAARGPESLNFPWGQEFDGTKGNYCDQNCSSAWKDDAFDDGHAKTAPVGSLADGASWIGALDMAGNVWEWVNDWYDELYYADSPQLNPQGPQSGSNKVLRGGSWGGVKENLRGADRSIIGPGGWAGSVGFRCSLSPSNTELAPTAALTPEQRPEEPVLGSSWQRTADNMTMVYVPPGTFSMGSEDGNDNEKPAHEVSLDGFWIDQTEVSNEQFEKFVSDTGYETTAEKEGSGWIVVGNEWLNIEGANWQHPQGPDSDLTDLGNHPVVLTSWEDAHAYCAWSGGLLPSEAQWEYAAKGPQNLSYPWGPEFDSQKSNYCDLNCPMDWNDESSDDGFARTSPVGSYADGVSWVGALDMVGNVWEWVDDWVGEQYYANSPQDNPLGPEDGSEKVLHGGAWVNQAVRMRGSDRNIIEPDFRTSTFGFRCAQPGE